MVLTPSPLRRYSGFEAGDMDAVATMLHDGISLARDIKARSLEANPQARLKDFISAMGEPQAQQEMEELRTRVCSFCSAFDTVGFDKDDMRYKLE
jgi:hypothetical protein